MNERSRTWGLRLVALGIAIGLWFNFSFQAREAPSERLVEASVSYNRPRGYVVLDQVQSVNVLLRGSSKAIRRLTPYMVSLQVDLSRASEGTVSVPLGPENLLMPDNLEVVSIEPNPIRVGLDREITQRLPVTAKLTGKPAGGATRGAAEVLPNQVLVTGPASLLARVTSLSTSPVSLDEHTGSFEEVVSVVTPDPLIQVVPPSKVTVQVSLQPPVAADPAVSTAKKKGNKT
ncbi:MAG: CdaR family protein [Acidobacteriota bacterium]|nr:CdaR family protein [Acidobacteriota bacterium]